MQVCTRIQTHTFKEFKSNGHFVKRFWPHCNMGMVGKEGYQCPEHVFSIAIGWLLPSVVVCTILPRPLLQCSSTQTFFLQNILDPLNRTAHFLQNYVLSFFLAHNGYRKNIQNYPWVISQLSGKGVIFKAKSMT